MLLSDPRYLFFLSVVFGLFYVLRPGRSRVALLLSASYFFYFNLTHYYILVLPLVTAIAYAGGILLQPGSRIRCRGVFLASICGLILAPLMVFKYATFTLETVASSAAVVGYPLSAPMVTLALPVGLSFFTFAAIGYLADVYLGVIRPEHDVFRFALFVAFFPVVTAGPIERGGRFLPQLELEAPFSRNRALEGMQLIFLGMVLKVLFADTLVVPVNAVYGEPASYLAIEKLCAVIFYPFYIYADSAGYALLAIGSAKMLGVDVRPNFHQPYLSSTIPEFWRNWHISLSSWVRDYLFVPMRVRWRNWGGWGISGALVLSFLMVGIWHGPSLCFAVFGLLHGTLVVASIYTLAWRDAFWSRIGLPKVVLRGSRVIVTFVLVMLTFVVYRADSIDDANLIFRDICSFDLLKTLWQGLTWANGHYVEISSARAAIFGVTGWLLIALLVTGDILVRNKITIDSLYKPVQIVLYISGIVLLINHGTSGYATEPFLYYRY